MSRPDPEDVYQDRPDSVPSITQQVETGCGNIYVIVGTLEGSNAPYELQIKLGKAGGCMYCNLEAIARLTTLCLKCGATTTEIVNQLKNLKCPSKTFYQSAEIHSCPDAVAKVLDTL